MATLDLTKIRGLWEKPKNRAEIERAHLDNQRQLFHAQLSVDRTDSNEYLTYFLARVQAIMNNEEKFRKFDSLLSFPLSSNHLVSKGSDEWNKVFKAQDRVDELRFVEEADEVDFQAFLEKINFTSVIEQSLFNKVKQAVNTVCVVDVSTVVEGQTMTEPYVYFIETGKLHDVDTDRSGQITYLMFETGTRGQEGHRIVAIDDMHYRTLILNQDGSLSIDVESAHELGFCPATFAWNDIINPDKPIRRFNSVLEIVDDLDAYLMWKTMADHADLYASFPIMWKYNDGDCDPNADVVGRSDHGVPVTLDALGNPVAKTQSDYIGPGAQVEVTVPSGENASMGVPVGFVDQDPRLLVFNKDKIRGIEVKIIKHLTGVDNEIQNEKAFNESQIRAQYETRHAVLRYWAENMQYVHKFLLTTIAKLRYGDRFESATIDYGMDYFLYDTITAVSDYKSAKDAGLPMGIIMSRREVVMQIETRNSPNKKSRLEILLQLEPYVDVPLNQIDKLIPEYELKANFQMYINIFERENGDIINFGSEIDFRRKIEIIKTKLYDYVKESTRFQESNRRKGDDLREPGQGTEI